jgi:3'(2'), 5'-bisphosphate nucleotidase
MSLPVSSAELLDLAHQAGEAILEVYATGFTITDKPDNSPVTEADLAAHRLIVSTLERMTPQIPVLSEEAAEIPFETRRNWRRYWLIDPLDGTKEFIKGNGEFTVNIALIEDHAPSFGIIYAPVLDRFYFGGPGQGAWRRDGDGDPLPIQVRSRQRQPPVIAGSRSHASGLLAVFLNNLGAYELISMGSSLKSCLVAEGAADLYVRLGPTSEWDTGAAQAIVEAAGGRITDTQMRPLRYNTSASLLNPHFFVSGDRDAEWSEYLPSQAG